MILATVIDHGLGMRMKFALTIVNTTFTSKQDMDCWAGACEG